MESKVNFRPVDIAPQLIAYGEPEAAEKLVQLDDCSLDKIGVLAFDNYLVPKTILYKAICLAVVEYLEGSKRELSRKKRVFQKGSA
ncbi:hypothetical protein OF113_18230 [Ectopseudomonas chengduensis]|jgi:hypothetical protein|nr:hypothetical protein [Pseudomonas chengduensis]KJU77946.1 hypothetical protein N619_17650 [Pseudomonas oleovorans]UZT76949.1 hypothetical protein OF113_18230 [Pseudomonas chengduensis]